MTRYCSCSRPRWRRLRRCRFGSLPCLKYVSISTRILKTTCFDTALSISISSSSSLISHICARARVLCAGLGLQCTSSINSRSNELVNVIFTYDYSGDDEARLAYENLLCNMISSNSSLLDRTLGYLVRLLLPNKKQGSAVYTSLIDDRHTWS